MSQISYRANLTAAEIPLLSELQGRTIIISGPDQNFSRQANAVKDKDRDIGIPQAYYAHNVVPTDAGMESISYSVLVSGPADTDGLFTDVFELRDTSENVSYFVNTSSGRCYVLLDTAIGWLRTTDVMPAADHILTTAHVSGVTYIYFGGLGCFKYNFTTNTLDGVTLTGLDPTKILGITASNGYMIAYTATTVAWSSVVSATDFIPSLVTGSGGGEVQDIEGSITVCLPHIGGFMVHSTKNAVSFLYSGNAQYPFTDNGKQLPGSAGIASLSLAAYDANSSSQFAYTTAGLQIITSQQAQIIFAQVTDFLDGRVFEDFDETTLVFTVTDLITPMVKKLVTVSNRYLIISYGMTSLTHALIYDFGLERWGKLKINHVDCFEYSILNNNLTESPKQSVAFLQADGTVKLVVMSYDTDNTSGVLILGKYQYDRQEYLSLLETHLENIKSTNAFSLKVLTSIDGKNATASSPALSISEGNYRRYNSRVTGTNHSLVLIGSFHATSLVLKFAPAGKVR